jgi:hypothetical protein
MVGFFIKYLYCHDLGMTKTGFGLVNGFIDHLYTPLEIQVITAPPLVSTIHKLPQNSLSLFQTAVFTSRFLATASNSGNSSPLRAQVLSSQPPA